MNSAHILVLLSASALLGGCAGDAEKKDTTRTSRAWTCSTIAAPGGETLSCKSSGLIIDESVGTEEPCTGALDNAEACGINLWTEYDSSYICTAGSFECPPPNAEAGTTTTTTTTGGAGGSASSDDGSKSSDMGGSRGGAGSSNSDNADKAGDKGKDRGSEGGKKDDDDGLLSAGGSNGGGSSGAGGSSGEQYECRGKGDKRECMKKSSDAGSSGTSGGSGSSAGGEGGEGGEGGLSGGGGSTTTTSTGKSVTFDGSKDNGDGTSTWCWTMTEESGQDLSNWVIGTGSCQVTSRSPSGGSEVVASDPNSGLKGVKWNVGDGFSSGQFCVVIQGTPSAGSIQFSAKGPDVAYGMTTGPVCK